MCVMAILQDQHTGWAKKVSLCCVLLRFYKVVHAVTQTALGGLAVYPPFVNFLQCFYVLKLL